MAKRDSKHSAAAKVLAALAEAQGGTLDLNALTKLKHKVQPREADSVLRSLHKPHAFMMRKCKNCGAEFETNYCSTAYCSDECITLDLAKMGIKYDPFAKRRWQSYMYTAGGNGQAVVDVMYDYEPPEYISTETLNELEIWAKKFLADLDRLRNHAEEVETQQSRENLVNLDREFGDLWSEPAEQSPLDSQPETQEDPSALEESSQEQYYVPPTNPRSEPQMSVDPLFGF